MTSSSRPLPRISVGSRTCKSALVRSGIPGLQYALNPYVGCTHACVYCYATFMARHTGHTEPWGTFVDVKHNLAEVLAREVRRKQPGRVGLSTVCDPYQPIEAELGAARRALELLASARFPVSVMTKSDLVTRDIDILRRSPEASVEMTVTSLDENAVRFFEPGAPSTGARLEAARRLVEAGVEVGVFFGPVLPFFSDGPGQVEAVFAVVRKAGVRRVLVDKLNYLKSKYPRIRPWLARNRPEALESYERLLGDEAGYAARLRSAIRRADKHGLECDVLF